MHKHSSEQTVGVRDRLILLLEKLEPRLLLSAGALDLTFGAGGLVTTDFHLSGEGATAIAIQADAKIVVVGAHDGDFALARYNADGTLDGSFGTGGKVTLDFDGGLDFGQDVAIQADGKIVVAGSSLQSGTDHDFALARFNTDGSLDAAFGTGGMVTTDFGKLGDSGYGVAIQSDGKIVVAGHTGEWLADYDFAVARYNADGTLDGSFGTGGKVTTDFAGEPETGYSIAIQTDGKIVVAGGSQQGGIMDFALARYNTDGSLDTSFDVDGKVTTDFVGFNDGAVDVAIQSDGKIVAAGWSEQSSSYKSQGFALARYDTDGSLDTSFDVDGKVTTDFGAFQDAGSSVAIQADGKILVAGLSDQSGTGAGGWDFAMARYNTDGSLDTTFDGDGKVTTDIAGSMDPAGDLAVQSDGKIVLAGFAKQEGTAGDDFALARYLGDPDTTPPVVQGVDVGADLQSLIVQLNDDDLNAATATDLANFSLWAANGDANGDGDAFNDGDEVELAISSVTYDSATDQITIGTGAVLFDDYYCLEMDGDDAVGDGTLGVTDLAGNYLDGGDFVAELDLTALSAVDSLLSDLEALGLSTGTESSLSGKLEAALHLLEQDVGSDRSLTALMDAFIRGVNHWYEKGQIAAEDRDELVSDAEQILFGISLLNA